MHPLLQHKFWRPNCSGKAFLFSPSKTFCSRWDTISSWVVGKVTRLGYFWKVFLEKFHSQVAQIFDNFLGHFDKYWFSDKTVLATFDQQVLGEIWLLFVPTSGHTGGRRRPNQVSLFSDTHSSHDWTRREPKKFPPKKVIPISQCYKTFFGGNLAFTLS